ncbi:MAG: PadR family transcriptional regulator [Candidatus Bathyarchaeia archaeon]
MGGYDLIKYVHKRYGFLVSPGTAYSCLYTMERKGLLQGRQEGNKKVFSLTERGLNTFSSVSRLNGSLMRLWAEIFQGGFVDHSQLP